MNYRAKNRQFCSKNPNIEFLLLERNWWRFLCGLTFEFWWKIRIFLFLKVIDFMVDFRHKYSNVWKWDNLIDLQPQWVDFNGKRALNIFFWESLSPLLLSPHEALGHKFWLKGGEREKKILGDTGSLSISLGQNITRKPWIIENMTWKN